ncbi:MAG: AIR synthase-related protein, partial [Alphaproteobacteria bacterium]
TDVTGFGLLGHLLEVCRGSGVAARIDFPRLPLLPGVVEHAREGRVTGASARNWESCADQVELAPGLGDVERAVLADPQTSGGLLVACAADVAAEVVDLFRREGFSAACIVGEVVRGAPRVVVGSGA